MFVIVGPSASGKSDFALELAEAIGGEIVSADSVQIYRRFDIGSAKPSRQERASVPHHLIDALEPDDPADAARFVELAESALASIRARGLRPVVCGGTFLWVRALVYGLAKAPPASAEVRARHRELAERFGRAHLHAELARVDPVSHARLAPNDFVRVSRALEVYELSGKPLSAVQAEHGFAEPRHAVRLLGIAHTRAALHERIERRVRAMFEAGWLDEVRGLLDAGYGDARALNSVGYRQVRDALLAGGELDRAALGERVISATRAFVRHQLTWLRDRPVEWLEPDALERFCESAARQTDAPRADVPAPSAT